MAISTIQVAFDAANVELDIATTSSNAAGTNWFIGIEGPAGTIKVLDTEVPDGTGTGVTVSIPDISPAILDGAYTIEVRIEDPGGYTENQKGVFTLAQTGAISYEITHTASVITFRDTTAYPNQTGSPAYARASLVTKPVPAGGISPATVSFSGAAMSISMALGDGKVYENVTWYINGAGTGEFTETLPFALGYSGVWEFIYTRAYSGSASHFVVVGTDPCGFIDCLDGVWRSLLASAAARGGLRAVEPYKAEQIALMLGHTAMYNYWRACGNIEQAEYYYSLLASLGDCEMDTAPRAVTGQPTSGVWVTIPPSSYINGFGDSRIYDPLMYMVSGDKLFFKGVVTVEQEDTAGLDMVDPAYWQSVGITFYEETWIPCIDASETTSKADLYYARIKGGTIRVYSYSANSLIHDFALVGPLLLIT